MIISQRADPFATTSISPSASAAPIVVDNTPLSSLGMTIIKIYAFGGLAFMVSIVAAAIGYWIWIVIVKREFADSPPELELYPERIREREKVRIARLKRQKEERHAARKRREEQKFSLPPVKYERKDRSRSSSLPRKPAMEYSSKPSNHSRLPRKPSSSISHLPAPRKSSISSSPSKGKRVSWASSTSTLDCNGTHSEKPMDEKTAPNPYSLTTEKSPFRPQETLISRVPRARISLPHLATSIEGRSPRGRGMIASTTPDIAASWAKSSDPFENPCNCKFNSESVGPLDTTRQRLCEVHRYRG